MTAFPRITSRDGLVAMEQLGVARGARFLAGGIEALELESVASGWPGADTITGLTMSLATAHDDGDTPFLVLEAATGCVVGEAGIKAPPGPDGYVEIGYGLAASARGRGLGTATVRCLTEWALGRTDCSTVLAEVLVSNLPSRRALERVGYSVQRSSPIDVCYQLSR